MMDGLDASADAAADAPQFVAYVPLPDQKEIEQRVRSAFPTARVMKVIVLFQVQQGLAINCTSHT